MTTLAASVQPTVERRAAPATLHVTTFGSFDEIAAIEPSWYELARQRDASLYEHPAWCRVWWRHFSNGRTLRVFTVHRGDELCGVLPMCIDTVRLGPLQLRVARLLGADSTPAVYRPLVEAAAEPLLRMAVTRLVEVEKCDAVAFGPMAESDHLCHRLRSLSDDSSWAARLVRDDATGVQTVIDLPDSAQKYRASLSKNQRYQLRKGRRRLEEHHDLQVRIARNSVEINAALDRFVALHEVQWREQRRVGHFRDWPRAEAFHRDLLHGCAKDNSAIMFELLADDEVIEAQLALRCGRWGHCRLAARSIDARWNECGVGRLGLVTLLEHMAESGVRSVDAGTGAYTYKNRLGARECAVRSMVLARRDARIERRVRRFLAAADTWHRLYYRAWYCRLGPKLGVLRGPLCQSWIRSRLS